MPTREAPLKADIKMAAGATINAGVFMEVWPGIGI